MLVSLVRFRCAAGWCPPAFLALLALAAPGQAATRNVPTDYANIQAAVNAAQSGDTVLVANGTYSGDGNRDIDFHGKNLTVTSQNGAASTIIDCGGSLTADGSGNHRGFYLHSGETNAVVSGLTVKSGYEQFISGTSNNGRGGGIYILSSSVTVQNCIVTGNTADYGGGVCNENPGSAAITLIGCTISGNNPLNTTASGGGVYNDNSGSGTVALTGCTIGTNKARVGGGVVNRNGSGTITLTACTFINNTVSNSGGGGGVANYGFGSGAITLTGCICTGNTAPVPGGSGGTFGGGVYNYSEGGGTITLVGCTLIKNVAAQGGGLYSVNLLGVTTLTNCAFTNNTGEYNSGSAIYNFTGSGGTLLLTNCTLAGNVAPYGYSFYNSNSNGGTTTLTNCTLAGNTAAPGLSGGIYNDNAFNPNHPIAGTLTLTNDILYGDTGAEITNSLGDTFAPVVTYCDVQGGYTGVGNINADPVFVTRAVDLYDVHVQAGSPCFGAGTSAAAPATDKDSNLRPVPPSIGAYDTASVPPFLASLTFPTPIQGGTVPTATVTLSGVTSSDVVVGLSSSDSSVVRVFRSVIIPAGSSSATFALNTFRSHITQTVTIRASLGSVALTKDLTITGR